MFIHSNSGPRSTRRVTASAAARLCPGPATGRPLVLFAALLFVATAGASQPTALPTALIGEPYPATGPDRPPPAETIIAQVWYVNHLRAVRQFGLIHRGNRYAFLVYRSPGGRYRFRTLERMLKNDFPADSGILARDLAVFYYPLAVRGSGILITDYLDPDKSQSVQVWLPALRKVRRFPAPQHDDAYAGTVWTLGDVSLRKPQHERHRLLRTERFAVADGGPTLHRMALPADRVPNRLAIEAPDDAELDRVADRLCYVVRSQTRFDDYWYDYRVSWIDVASFADYRTLYYKDDRLVKVVDRLWRPMRGVPPNPDMADPRAQYWKVWYGKNLLTGYETMAVVPDGLAVWNGDIPDATWTESYLRRLRR